jgi:hypothetical protein
VLQAYCFIWHILCMNKHIYLADRCSIEAIMNLLDCNHFSQDGKVCVGRRWCDDGEEVTEERPHTRHEMQDDAV